MLRNFKSRAILLLVAATLAAGGAFAAETRASFPNGAIFDVENKALLSAATGAMLDVRSTLGSLPTGSELVDAVDLSTPVKREDGARIDAMILDAVKAGKAARTTAAIATQPYTFWLAEIHNPGGPTRKLLGLERKPATLTQLFPGVSEQHVKLPFGAGQVIVSVLTLGGLDAAAVDGYRCLGVANSANSEACPAAALVFDAKGVLLRVKTFPAAAIGVNAEQGYEAKLTDAGLLTLSPLVNGVTHAGKRWRPVTVEIGPAP